MTVCIAAIASRLGAIVTVSDTLLSDDFSSVNTGPKLTSLVRGRWSCLYAGNPTVFRDLTTRIVDDLKQSNSAATYQDVMDAVERAYDAVLEHSIERQILAPLGMTRKEFIDCGAKKLGENLFREITTEIRLINLATELLVFGFDEHHVAHIFSSDFTGRCTLHDDVRYHAIGAGSWAALGWLSTQKAVAFSPSIPDIVYKLCEAKFAAETARSVGPRTVVLVSFKNGSVAPIVLHGAPIQNAVRTAWESRIHQPSSPEALELIERALLNAIDTLGISIPLSLPESDRQQKADPERSKPSS
jgi:CubicO group peptidase (beta-lactamase class C family)